MADTDTCPITLYTREEIINSGGDVLEVVRNGVLVQIYEICAIAKWLSRHTLFPHLDIPTFVEIEEIKQKCTFVPFVPPKVEQLIYYNNIPPITVDKFGRIVVKNEELARDLLSDLKIYFSTYFKHENFPNAYIYLIGNCNRILSEPRRKYLGILKGISLYDKIKTINLVRIYVTNEDEICCNFRVFTNKPTANALKVSFFANDFNATHANIVNNVEFWTTYEYIDMDYGMNNNIPNGSKIIFYNSVGELFFDKTDSNKIKDYPSLHERGGGAIKKLNNQCIILAGIKNENLIKDIIKLGGVVRTKPSGKTTLVVIPRRDYTSAAVVFAETKNIKILTIGRFCKKYDINIPAIDVKKRVQKCVKSTKYKQA